jgi:hypothetical protein
MSSNQLSYRKPEVVARCHERLTALFPDRPQGQTVTEGPRTVYALTDASRTRETAYLRFWIIEPYNGVSVLSEITRDLAYVLERPLKERDGGRRWIAQGGGGFNKADHIIEAALIDSGHSVQWVSNAFVSVEL